MELLQLLRTAWRALPHESLRSVLDAIDRRTCTVHDHPNFEHLLSAATAIAMRKESEVFSYTAGLAEPLRSLEREDPELLNEIHHVLIGMMRDHLLPKDAQAFVAPYLKTLVQAVMKSDERTVFTLNYDRSLETVLEAANISYATGFRTPSDDEAVYLDQSLEYWPVRHEMDRLQQQYEQMRWRVGAGGDPFDFAVDGSQAAIRLVKVHGSIGWYRMASNPVFWDGNKVSPEDRIVNLRDAIPERGLPMLIAGASGKERLEEPFVTLLRRLYDALLKAEVVVTIGYSFSDKHINDLLLRVLLRERTLGYDLVVVNGPNWPQGEVHDSASFSAEASSVWPMLCRAAQQNVDILGLSGLVVLPYYAEGAITDGHLDEKLAEVCQRRSDRLQYDS